MEEQLRNILFPPPGADVQTLRTATWELLQERIGQPLTQAFFARLPDIQQELQEDLRAALEGDPAAAGEEEVAGCYPGFYAVTVYRLAHVLWELGVPVLPRQMTEKAHSRTGIDIHPGAKIGSGFFVDHGTGVVIGETAEIGKRVKLYHGVTLGALSTGDACHLRGKKRHPTVEDDVTIYANATILGGETVIGRGCVIGANVLLTASVAPYVQVSAAPQVLRYKKIEP